MTDQPQTPLHRIGIIAEEIRELQSKCDAGDTLELAWLANLMHQIGELQLTLAQADADRAMVAEMERQFPQVRTSLD